MEPGTSTRFETVHSKQCDKVNAGVGMKEQKETSSEVNDRSQVR